MRVIILGVGLLLAVALSAQTDSTFQLSISNTYKSVHTLTRSDIEHLPVFNFMQLVQGAFPYVGNESNVEQEYLFVVNGFVLTNPNAINVSQIESISFYPVGTEFTKGSLTKKGTFVVTIKPNKNGFGFSTHTGITFPNKNTQLPNGKLSNAGDGFSSLNELSYNHTRQKWFISNAFSFRKSKAPRFTLTVPAGAGYMASNSSSEAKHFRFSNFGGYEFNKRWKAEGGLFYTSQPGSSESHTNYDYGWTSGSRQSNSDGKVNLFQGNLGVTASLSPKFINRLTVEFTHYNDKANSKINSEDRVQTGESTTTDKENVFAYAFSNRALWQAINTSSIHLAFSVLTHYRFAKTVTDQTSFAQNYVQGYPPAVNSSFFKSTGKNRSFIVGPSIDFNLKQVLFVQAGGSYDTYSDLWGPNKNKKFLPDAGLRLELSSLIKESSISSLQLSVNYNQYITSFERLDPIGGQYVSTLSNFSFMSSWYPNPSLYGNYPKVGNWLGSVTIGVSKDRLVLKALYRKHEKTIASYISYPGGGLTMISEPLTSEGLSFEVKASVIQKQNKNWDIYVTAFQDKYSRRYAPYMPTPAYVILLDSGKAPWRSAIKTSLRVHKFFAEASTLININELATDKDGNVKNDMTRYLNNFLVAGYTLPIKKSEIDKIDFSAEASGLFASKSFALGKYLGIGVKLSF